MSAASLDSTVSQTAIHETPWHIAGKVWGALCICWTVAIGPLCAIPIIGGDYDSWPLWEALWMVFFALSPISAVFGVVWAVKYYKRAGERTQHSKQSLAVSFAGAFTSLTLATAAAWILSIGQEPVNAMIIAALVWVACTIASWFAVEAGFAERRLPYLAEPRSLAIVLAAISAVCGAVITIGLGLTQIRTP